MTVSSAIGLFEIGISPIGPRPPFDPNATVISQYANSPTLQQLIQSFNGYLDQTANLVAFYDLIWNVATAQGYGLDVWGRIVGLGGRTLQISAGRYLGFEEATGVSADPFNQSPLYLGAPVTSNYALSDDDYRTLIYAKALANICDGSIPSINAILMTLFVGRGNAYVADSGGMAMVYTFNFALTPVEVAIISQSGVLPKPVGVDATISEL